MYILPGLSFPLLEDSV